MKITSKLDINTYLSTIESESRKQDIIVLIEMMQAVTGYEPRLWDSIVGFGRLHYKYQTGHEGEMPILGFANRKQALTLYLGYQVASYQAIEKLGKFKHGKGCLYIKKLSDVDLNVLNSLLKSAMDDLLNSKIITKLEVMD